ncbi:MAG: methyltransferase domain-containing protein, partial [Thermodesulfobacteriota bacterium]
GTRFVRADNCAIYFRQHRASLTSSVVKDYEQRMAVLGRAWGEDPLCKSPLKEFKNGLADAIQTEHKTSRAFTTAVGEIIKGNTESAAELMEWVSSDVLSLLQADKVASKCRIMVKRNLCLDGNEWNLKVPKMSAAFNDFFDGYRSEVTSGFFDKFIDELFTVDESVKEGLPPAVGLATRDGVEILSPDLLENNQEDIDFIDMISNVFTLSMGWHYMLDFLWLLKVTKLPPGSTILDAGAGAGLMQYLLAYRGYNVISVDFSNRAPQQHITNIIPVELMDDDEISDHKYLDRLQNRYGNELKTEHALKHELTEKIESVVKICNNHKFKDAYLREFLRAATGVRKLGSITYYRADFTNMMQIPPESIDCVVSVSALEHNEHDDIKRAVKEFNRVLKPGGRLAITTSAAKEDWYHEQSMGWSYSENSLVDLFGLDEDHTSNYDQHDELFEKLKNSKELESRLAPFYFESGENGMPWGVWKPEYQAVGVIKIKKG